jgi:hypothetical protein
MIKKISATLKKDTMKFKFYIVIILLCGNVPGYGQGAVAPGTEMQELVRIADVYDNIPNLTFHMYVTYADSLTWWQYLDTMDVFCKISYGKSFLYNDDIELLQGREYSVYVDKLDSFIVATPVREQKSIFQAPLLDSTFRAAHVLGMSVSIVTSTTWRFKVTFKPESYYLTYDMLYDPKTGLVESVNFHVRNEGGTYGIPTDHIVCATVTMGDFSYEVLDAALFNENRYFYKLNGSLNLQQAWQQFHLQN